MKEKNLLFLSVVHKKIYLILDELSKPKLQRNFRFVVTIFYNVVLKLIKKEIGEETMYAARTLSREWNDSICIENTSPYPRT